MKVEYIYLKSILILSNSLFKKQRTHLSTLKAQNHQFAKHAQPQTEKPRAYKKKSVVSNDRAFHVDLISYKKF